MDFYRRTPTEDEESEDVRNGTGCLGTCLKLFLIFLVPLLIALSLLPKAFTSEGGRKRILDYINRQVAPASFTCASLDVGWFTPLEIRDATLSLPRDGVKVTCPKLLSDRAFFKVFPVGRINLGHLQLIRPECVVTFPDPEALAAESGDGLFLPVADLAGRGTIEKGTLVWARSTDGKPPISFTKLDASVDMPSFWKPFHFRGTAEAGGGQLSIEGDLQSVMDLCASDKDDKKEKKGDATPQTIAVSIKHVDASVFHPFAEGYTGIPMRLAGIAQGDFNLRMNGSGELSGKSALTLTRFSVQAGDHLPSPPATVNLDADFSIDASEIRFSPLTLESPWLTVQLDGGLKKSETGFNRTGKLGGRATLKLPELIKDFGAVWHIPATLSVETGAIDLDGELRSDEERLTVSVKAASEALAWTSPAGRIAPKQPPVLAINAKIPHDNRQLPEVTAFSFKSSFAELSGKGPLDALTITGNLDLGRFDADYHPLFPLCPRLAGTLFLHAGTQRQGEHLNLALLAKAKTLSVAAPEKPPLTLQQGSLTLKSATPFNPDGILKRELNDGAFEVKVPAGSLTGSWQRLVWDETSVLTLLRGFKINTKVPVTELGNALGGSLSPEWRQRLQAAEGDFYLNGTAEISGGQAKALLNGLFQTVKIQSQQGLWSIPDLRFESRLSQGTGGSDHLRADTVFSGIGSFTRNERKILAEKRMQAQLILDIPPDGKVFPIKSFTYRGVLGECECSGQLVDPAETCLLNIAGTWSPDLAAVTRLLNTQGINGFFLTGQAKRKIQFQAPLGCGLDTFLANGKGQGSLHLQSAEGFGLFAGAADLTCSLGDGALSRTYAPPLNGGKLTFTPTLIRTPETTLFRLPPKTRVLDRVNLTQPMVDMVLANVSPLFQGCKIKKGNLSLDSVRLAADLHQPPDRQLNAAFNLMMNDIELEMGANLRAIIPSLLVKDHVYRSRLLTVPINVKNGEVSVDTPTFIQQFLLDAATGGKAIESDPGFLDQIKREFTP
ncbi:MAG: hypothetical protein J6334_04775 [Kiritimatiellae bacterium]|nr:hypothetical protein [Kiritimatiellia bacterium]